MKHMLGACLLSVCAAARADKYGIDEALAESSGSLSDMVWGALLIAAIYWIWKKFFG